MASMKKVAALGAAFLGTFILGAGAGIYGEKKYNVSSKFTKNSEATTPSAEVVMAQQAQTSQPANNKPVMNNNNGHSNQPQQQK